ncbi:MAG: Xaa-Pro aminopeptidase [Acidobacteriota bacterium]|nr:Xaa-Pro aminopeptidase [Acidobacteriota bacterium]
MKIRRPYYRPVMVVMIASMLMLAMFSSTALSSRNGDKPTATVIRVTPPAPVFDDSQRLAELASRRARVAEKLGANSILVLFSTEPRVYTNDVDYHYRQENNLFYLTNLNQKGATLVLMPGNPQLREVLFLPKRDPAAETWTGHMYSPEEARQLSGVREIWEAKEFEPFMRSIRARQAYRPKEEGVLLTAAVQPVVPPVPQTSQLTAGGTAVQPASSSTAVGANVTTTNSPSASQPIAQPVSATGAASTAAAAPTGFETLFAAMGRDEASLYILVPREDESREYKPEQNFAIQWAKSASGLTVRTSSPIFAQMRLRKSPTELKLLQHAIDITSEGIGRSMAIAGRSKWEYEIDAEVLYTFKRRNADHWGYPSIVGCGPNATTLHYVESQGPITSGNLLLMDVGAEYGHYTADVTRTFPVNGKFSPTQAEIYQIVYDAQEATARASRPGAIFPTDVHNAAVEKVKDGLLKLGLITDREGTITISKNLPPQPQYRLWFMHGTSHWLGMNVHDVGGRGVALEPGMVFTNEPGVYVRADALDNLPKTPENEKFIAAVRPAFEKYKNIGVRIEDDMLVTNDAAVWMTKAIPRSIADIEAFMARAPKEVQISALDQEWLDRRFVPASVVALNVQRLLIAGMSARV